MAIIDKKHYKFDKHNEKLMNLFYDCFKTEKSCKIMAKNLVFYDRDEIDEMHSQNMMSKADYDISKLEPIPFLNDGEKINKVVPLDKGWIGALIENKKTQNLVKVMYISHEGEGYLSDNVEDALNSTVPEEVYFEDASQIFNAYIGLDEKYKDGKHDEFLRKYYAISRKTLTDFFAQVIKNDETLVRNFGDGNGGNITIEEIIEKVNAEFRKKEKCEEFEHYQTLDLLCSMFGVEKIAEIDRKYNNPDSLVLE